MVVMSLLAERYFPNELYAVLKALEKGSEATTIQISELTGVSHSFLLSIIPSLKDKGFVSVVKGKTDKRKKFVKLTDGGSYLLSFGMVSSYLRRKLCSH